MTSGIKKALKVKTSSALTSSFPPYTLPLTQNCMESKTPTDPALPHSVSKRSAEQVTVFLIQINDPVQPCLLSRKLESVGRSK